ncbi:MAG: hypothetical protein QM765_39980 [Myxococcales bacterium]
MREELETFLAETREDARGLPKYVEKEFQSYPRRLRLAFARDPVAARESATIVADLPSLTALELWFGSARCGCDCTLDHLSPLLDGQVFPGVTRLGLQECRVRGRAGARHRRGADRRATGVPRPLHGHAR